MLNKVAVVIPFYKNTLSAYEKIALQQCQLVLSAYPKIAVKPQNLTLPDEAELVSFTNVVSFDDHYFNDLAGYNRLMLSAGFYQRFADYDYILIYQQDSFVFKDDLADWCAQDFDYIGAPWIIKTYHKNALSAAFIKAKLQLKKKLNRADNSAPNRYQLINQVGNGGFSLRRVKKFYDLCLIMKPAIDHYLAQTGHFYNEDVFWSIEVNRQKRLLNIPACETALKFAFEVPPVKAHLLNQQNLPFGCHDWDKYAKFWRPIFKNEGYTI